MAELLADATRTPIGELSPTLSAASTRSLRAIVTLIWPYSSSNSSLKVLLVEPDFRLRKTRGQVRVLFTGSSARIVFEAGIGSGDEVLLSLAGAEWVKDELSAQTDTPGRGIEWDLKYSERLVLQILQSETNKISLLDIDHPAPKPGAESINVFPISELELATLEPTVTSTERPKLVRTETNEYPSPAFIKRARVSYGSLFESAYDIFAEDDGTIQGKGRKRTRFSRDSSSWRYSSHSPSPTIKDLDTDTTEANLSELEEDGKPSMADEGCQTIDFEEISTTDRLRSLAAQISNVEQRSPLQNRTPDWEAIAQSTMLGYNEANVDKMLPPPRPNLVLEVGAQVDSDDHQVLEYGATITPLSPRLNPVSSDALPLVSPLISSAFGPQDAQTSRSVSLSVTNHEGAQINPFEDYHDPADQYGHWQTEMVSQEQISHLMSPYGPEGFLKETYPEPDVMETQQHHLQAGPYYGSDRIQSPASTGSHNQKHTSHGGFALSRSQSARSEIVDLTEASDEDADTPEFSDNIRFLDQKTQIKPKDHRSLFVGASDEESGAEEDSYNIENSIQEQTDTLQYREDLFLDDSEREYEMNELSDNARTAGEQQAVQQRHHERVLLDKSGGGEDEERSYDDEEDFVEEFDEDEEGEGDSHRGFRSINDNQSEDRFDEDEEDISYDEEDLSEGEDAVTAIKQTQGVPEVIDLLSSDEEEVEHDTASVRSGEVMEENISMDSSFNSRDGSVSEIDADTEVEDEEVSGDEVEDDEDSRNEIEITQLEGGVEQADNRSPSVEPGEEDADGPNTMLELVQQSTSGVATNKRHLHYHTGNRIGPDSTSTRPHDELGGMDGAVDDPTATEKLYPTLPLDDVAVGKARTSLRPIAPGSANREPSTQEPSAQHFSYLKGISQESVIQANVNQQESNQELLSDAYDNRERINKKNKNVDAVTRESHTQESISNDSMDKLHDTQEYSSQVKVRLEDNDSHGTNNQQLPTPEATQMTGDFAPELSSHSPDIVEPSTPPRQTITSINVKSVTDSKTSPSVSVDEPYSPDTYDASAELALSVLDSPSKELRKKPSLSNAALRVKLTRPLQTTLGIFTPLKLIRFHLEQKVDVIALVTTQPPEPQRAKNRPRHYHVRFNIIDASVSPSGIMGAQIFRPFKSALPIVKPGDGILLRNFAVKAEARAGFALRSDEGSSWVVFKDNNEEEVRGPPVEYEDGEREHVARLKTWFRGLDSRSKERLDRANGDIGTNGDKRR